MPRYYGYRATSLHVAVYPDEPLAFIISDREEKLWAIHEANIGDFFETVEVAKVDKEGKAETDAAGNILAVKKERPRLISDLAPKLAQVIEDVAIDSKGRAIPKLYSKLQAGKELRAMLNICKPADATAVSRLSDAELIAQLSDMAKQLGVDINLNYSFAQQSSATETDGRRWYRHRAAHQAGNDRPFRGRRVRRRAHK